MSKDARTEVLEAFARLSSQDAEALDPLITFLPLLPHRRALWKDTVVVLGGRGSGKTALFRLVNDPRTAARLRDMFESEHIPEALWFDAFSVSARHPEVGTLEAFATSAGDITLRAFWMAHLLRRVREEAPDLVKIPAVLEPILAESAADIGAWVPAAEARLGAVNAALDDADRALDAADRTVVAAYDNLDRIGQFDPEIRRRYVSTLLALWLSLSTRYRRLRGKVFLRDDLFDAGELGFADATKLRSRAETLTWDHAALLRLAVRHLAGQGETVRAWLREVPGLDLHDRGELGWMPGEMKNEVQHAFVGRFAGKVIGKGVLKDYTSLWMLGRLRDGQGRVTPRALLWFLGFAAEEARKRPLKAKGPLVTASDLLLALRRASRERVQEIREEYPLVERVENLRGMTLWLERGEVVERLAKPRPGEREGIPARGDVLLAELLRLGVLRARDDGTLDVPDIYRYSFEITPDYSTAWKDLLLGNQPAAIEQFGREWPNLDEILRLHATTSDVAKDEIDRGDYVAARAKCERALEVAKNARNWDGEADLWLTLGTISLLEDDHARARDELQQALSISRRNANRQGEAMALVQLASAHMGLGRLDAAARDARRSVELFHASKDTEREFGGYYLLSCIAERRGNARCAYQLRTYAAHITTNHRVSTFIKYLRNSQASRHGLTPEAQQEIEREADAAYARDRGWSLIRAAFPDDAY